MRTLLAVAFLSLAAAAHADWVPMGEHGGATFYIDPASVIRNGNLFRVSAIQDLAQPEAGARSRLVLYEVDCGGFAIRSLAITEYSESMAKGSRVSEAQRESPWLFVTARTGTRIAPRTPFAEIVRRVCATP
jgi:hypothetical protein